MHELHISGGKKAALFSRRRFLHLAAGASTLSTVSRVARAQTYPTRPVRLIATTAAGGTQGILARLIGQWLSERLSQPFIIESRPGGGGIIATEAVVKSRPDGYTLLLIGTANTVNATLYDKLNFNFIRDIAPVAGITRTHLVMVVHPSVPAKTVPEFIAYANANPGKINMASSGNGSASHMSGELFKMMTRIDMVHVPYRGGAQALTDLIGGQVQVVFINLPTAQYVKAGKLRVLAVTTRTRAAEFPDIPTVGEFVPGYESSAWYGIGVPKNTSAVIVEKLNNEINAALADPKIRARLADQAGTALPGSPTEFGTLIADETEKWAKVIKFAGIKAE
jgi:tripartite-type tricarboxylate transporter receptor subunit TctC